MTNVRSFNRKPRGEPLLTHQVHCNVTPKDYTKAKTLKLSWNQLLNIGINSTDVLRNLRTKDIEIYNLKQRIEKLTARLQFYNNKKNALLQENCKLRCVILDKDAYYAKEEEEFSTFLFNYKFNQHKIYCEPEASGRDEESQPDK